MKKFEFLNNYADAVCVFSSENKVIFKNSVFKAVFSDVNTIQRFKNRFNSDLSILFFDGGKQYTPIDFLLESKENFNTICSYQNFNGDFSFYYIYSFQLFGCKVAVFKDVTAEDSFNVLSSKYIQLEGQFKKLKESENKFSKLQDKANAQVMKMAVINRLSLIIRETNDLDKIFQAALSEINNLLGSFKTYFSVKHSTEFEIKFSLSGEIKKRTFFSYESEITEKIRNKEIIFSPCFREHINSEELFPKGVKRIIIPVYNKTNFLGIITSFTKQKISVEDNREVLQSISVQLSSAIIQSELISQLNKKNLKLQKTLDELKETQLQLINSEKLASLGQLVSGVAHEINTPLAAINSNSDMIKKILSADEAISENRKNLLIDLNNIDIEASSRISSIVKSLKKFVRLDEAEFQLADINKELDLTLKLIEHETKDKINIVRNYSQVPEIYCSVNRMNQVFMNLLINACHSIKEKNCNGEIIVTTFEKDNKLYVKIKDNGCGISPEIQTKIFNTGFTTKKSGMGTGLGLSISQKILEMHKGNISFTTKVGTGTEFTVTIPYQSSKHL